MEKNKNTQKVYKLKNSWKTTIKVLAFLAVLLVISSFIGYYNSYDHISNRIGNSYDNIIYSYDAKAQYVFNRIDNNNENLIKWNENIKVTNDNDVLIVNSKLNKDELINLIDDIENDINNLNNESKLKPYQIENINLYNDRIKSSVEIYNNDVENYKNMISSKNAFIFKYQGKNFEDKEQISLQIIDIN